MAEMKRSRLAVPLVFVLVIIAVVAIVTGFTFGPVEALCVALAGVIWLFIQNLFFLFRLIGWLENPVADEIPSAGRETPWRIVFEMLRDERHQFEKNAKHLQTRETRYRKTLSSLPDGITLVKSDWRIDWCNESAEDQLGLDSMKDRGQPVYKAYDSKDFIDYLTAGNFDKPLVIHNSENAQTIELHVVVLGRKNAVIVTHDVTDRDKLDSIRRDFVANVSHELRTPLTVINGFIDLAISSKDPGPVRIGREHLALMKEKADRMSRLVNDLLTLSKLEESSPDRAPETVNVPVMIRETAKEGRAISGGRHEITESAEPFCLKGYKDEILSAIGNLVANAVRYTPPGGHISITWKRSPEWLELAVKDDGIGIAPEFLPRLTERFYRVDKSRSRDSGGTGLGLAIVKHVLIRHGGHLKIESEPGKGSTFTMQFPTELEMPMPEVIQDSDTGIAS